MTWDRESGEPNSPTNAEPLSAEQLRGLQYGVAAIIMPVSDGWRVHYFSIPDFEGEPGTTFPSFDAAIAAVEEVLPEINSREQRARARQELRERMGRPVDSPE